MDPIRLTIEARNTDGLYEETVIELISAVTEELETRLVGNRKLTPNRVRVDILID